MGRGAHTIVANGQALLYGSRRGGQRPMPPRKPGIDLDRNPLSAEQLLGSEHHDLDVVLDQLWLVTKEIADGSDARSDLDHGCKILTAIGRRHQLGGEFLGVVRGERPIISYRLADGREVDTMIAGELYTKDLATDIIGIREYELHLPATGQA